MPHSHAYFGKHRLGSAGGIRHSINQLILLDLLGKKKDTGQLQVVDPVFSVYLRGRIEEKYELKAHRYNFDWVVSRVAESMGVTLDEVTVLGKSPRTVEAQALVCYWAHRKLAMTATEIARRLKIGQPAASRLSRRGEQIEKERGLHLID